MEVFQGTNIPINEDSSDNMNFIIDEYLTPRLMSFREICVYDEVATLLPDLLTWKTTYDAWLEGFNFIFRKNGKVLTDDEYTITDYRKGCFELTDDLDIGGNGNTRDVVNVTYQFDYFPVPILKSFVLQAIDNTNSGAVGPPADFDVENMPDWWRGVVADMAFAMAIEKLILDYDLWKGRLIFAIGPGATYDGDGGDIISQLETLKNNAEQRASKTLDNEKFKVGNYLSPPTCAYWLGIQGYGGSRNSRTGGKLRGHRRNRFY